jgi:hypothetical protein
VIKSPVIKEGYSFVAVAATCYEKYLTEQTGHVGGLKDCPKAVTALRVHFQ